MHDSDPPSGDQGAEPGDEGRTQGRQDTDRVRGIEAIITLKSSRFLADRNSSNLSNGGTALSVAWRKWATSNLAKPRLVATSLLSR